MRLTILMTAAVWLIAAPSAAQVQATCRFVCAPQFLIEPTWTVENLAQPPRVRTSAGTEERQGRETVFEIILAVDIPTKVPRLAFTAEAIVIPFAADNEVELELETNFTVIESDQTKGWIGSHVDIVDKFSPAERPTDRSAYTHKLNFEWDTAVAVFKWLPDGQWLRRVEVEGSLDFVATGLPQPGDIIDGNTLMDNASPWSLSLVVVLPVTP